MKLVVAILLVAALPALAAPVGSVVGSKHDLSITGPGPIKAESETQVCIFCHIAHGARSNRPSPASAHRPYESDTLRGRPGAPDGASRICLSCHDGTVALGDTVRRRIRMNGAAPGGRLPAGSRSNLGTDLRNTHPISLAPSAGAGLHLPAGHDPVKLDRSGKVQCTSCHDAHSEFGGSPEGKFLVRPTRGAELCLSCHDRPAQSSHQASGKTFSAAQGNDGGYASVGDASCRACHRSHGGDTKGRLLSKKPTEPQDALCLRCHDGSVARLDIRADMAKPYSHAVDGNDQHSPAEGPASAAHRLPEASAAAPRHAVCVDCHQPHEATNAPAVAPVAPGALAGTWGIDQAGRRAERVRFEYEVCFKCHGDSANQAQRSGMAFSSVKRAADDRNLRRVFDPASPSYHPVVAPGRNRDVPSLLPPYGVASSIYCGDCHASNAGPGAGGSGPRGPHGSIYPRLLERNYATSDYSVENPAAYALCYKCHDRDVLLSSRSPFPLHRSHVVGQRAPCSACHAPHGVSGATGGTVSGNAHLIDFDMAIVSPYSGGRREYASTGPRSGSCTLSCHGAQHDRLRY